MNNVGLDTARPQPARQPEPVASGLVGDDNALDLAPRLTGFSAPTIQKLQQRRLVGRRCAVAAVAQPSGTVTLVFTDIEGSTRLLEELGYGGVPSGAGRAPEVVRAACAGHGGYEVDNEGDAFFYAFASAQSAVGAIARRWTDWTPARSGSGSGSTPANRVGPA